MKNTLFVAILLFTFISVYAQKALTPADAGSKIHFIIKNFGINTGGDLTGMKGSIKFNPLKPSASSFDVTVDVNTIDTNNGSRDGHLKKEEYFNLEKYPLILLASTKIEATNKAQTYMFTGNITIKGTSKPTHFLFTATPKDGGYLFAGSFVINRLDFKVGSNSATLADNVKVSISALSK